MTAVRTHWAIQMNDTNPCASPATGANVDSQLMRSVATKLNTARKTPPTVIRTLTTWPGVSLLLVVGAVGTLGLAMLTTPENSPLTSHWPVGLACGVLGGILRDFGLARRVARIWPAQSEFIDWGKVDQFAE